MKKSINRRSFVKSATIIGAAASIMPSNLFASSNKLQIGVIGTGLRGQWMTKLFLNRKDVDIPVICDIDDRMIDMVLKVFEKKL